MNRMYVNVSESNGSMLWTASFLTQFVLDTRPLGLLSFVMRSKDPRASTSNSAGPTQGGTEKNVF